MCFATRKLTELFVNTPGSAYGKYPTHHILPHPHTNTYKLSQVSVPVCLAFPEQLASQLLKPVTSGRCTEMLNMASHQSESSSPWKRKEISRHTFTTAPKMKPVFG